MSLNVPKLRLSERLEYIEKNILYQTQQEIADELHVTRKTIQRDIIKWKNSPRFTNFLNKEFFHLYALEKQQNPSKALDRIMFLMTKYDAPNRKVKSHANVTTLLSKYRTIIEEETETTITESTAN